MLTEDYSWGGTVAAGCGLTGSEIPETELAPANSVRQPTITVLVLEDDELLRTLLTDQLESVGLRAVGVATISAAREKLEYAKFNLAIFDVQLPDGSGLDLCNSIADDSRFCGMPMIMLSNMNQPNMVRQTRAAGASFFLVKPYDPNVLLTVIERALGIDLQN